MPTLAECSDWRGLHLHGEGGDKIGEIIEIYLDAATGEAQWLAVKTAPSSSKLKCVPLARAVRASDCINVPFAKDLVKGAPAIGEGELSPDEERRLYEHYGVEWGEFNYAEEERTAMTRSEEELVVDKQTVPTGRARLRKYVVSEMQQVTIPVSREEVCVEREPIAEGEGNQAMGVPAIGEEEHEVTLYAEQPVVEKRVVAKERVRLAKHEHIAKETISDEVRKERIEDHVETETASSEVRKSQNPRC